MQGRSQADSIKVLLADDHTMFREGIASILGDYGSIEVVGQADNDEGAVELARLRKPDVVLMQVQMPIPRAKENLRRMREVSDPAPKVVIVTMIEDPLEVRELMELGASAYIVKSTSTEHLVAAVRASILDPKSKDAVVGMPRALLEEARGGLGGRALCQGARDPAVGSKGPLQPPDRHKSAPRRRDSQAPPHQHLPQDGGRLPGRSHQDGPV